MSSTPVSFEFFPPNTPVGDAKLKDVVQRLGEVKPEFFSVTYGAGGATRDKTLATVSAIAAAGFEVQAVLGDEDGGLGFQRVGDGDQGLVLGGGVGPAYQAGG